MRAQRLCGDHGDAGASRSALTARAPALVAAIVGTVFGLCAAPGLTWLDAGELGAAAFEIGIAHPPGFVVFAQIHGLIMHALPIGDAAFRGNLASGLMGVVALVASVQAVRALGVRAGPAVAGALLAGLNGLFVLHATTIEVYTGAAAWVAIAFWLVARVHRGDDVRDVGLLGLWIGLAAGHHAELRLFVLVGVPVIVWRARGRRLVVGLTAACVGGLVLLYLPARASGDLWRNWGDPSSVGALWDHVMGTRIRAAYADQFGQLHWADARRFGEQILGVAPGLLVLGLLGMIRAFRLPAARWLIAVWLLDTLYAIALNPMGLRDFQNGVPGLMALGMAAALALDFSRLRVTGPLLVAACVLAALPGIFIWQQRTDRGLPVWLEAADSGAPPEALAFVASDNLAAGYAFRQVVEGARPDLAVIVRQHAWDASSVGPVARRLPHATTGWTPAGGLPSFAALTSGSWPLVWEWATGLDAKHAPPLQQAVPWFRPVPGDDHSAVIGWLDRAGLSEEGKRHYGGLLDDLARWWLPRDPVKAAVAGRSATLVYPEGAVLWLNLGQAFLRAGDMEGAIESTREALTLDPDNPTARLNFARLSLTHDPRRVAALLDPVIEADPLNASALGVRGVARARTGDLNGAAADWERALAIDPRQPEARAGMAKLKAMRP